MATIDDFQNALEEAFSSGDTDALPGSKLEGSGYGFAQSNSEAYAAFVQLTEFLHSDSDNLDRFLEEWGDNRIDGEELTVAELAEEFGSGYFEGFAGNDLRDLYHFQYSSNPVAMDAQGWFHDLTLTSADGHVAYFFSHPSYAEHDSWAIIQDPSGCDARYFGFSWV